MTEEEANALVAAAYETAALAMEPYVRNEDVLIREGQRRIRALTPAAAKSALEAMLERARTEGREQSTDHDFNEITRLECTISNLRESRDEAMVKARAEGAAEEREVCRRDMLAVDTGRHLSGIGALQEADRIIRARSASPVGDAIHLKPSYGRRLADLYSALADSVESMSDEELLAEAAERGVDPAKERNKLVAMLRAALDKYDPAPASVSVAPTIEELIARSSLGTPEAKAIRAQADPADVARVMARVDELDDEDDGGDFEADQCGAVGDPRDPKTQVCVLEPGHDGPHRAIHVGTVEIVEWCTCSHKKSEHDKNGCFGSDQERPFGPRVHCKCSEFEPSAGICICGHHRDEHTKLTWGDGCVDCSCNRFEPAKQKEKS